MSNPIKYIAFNADTTKRVNLGGGRAISQKINLTRGENYELRFLIYKNFDDFYATSSTVFNLRIREKRQSSTDLAIALTASFVDATWGAGDATLKVYEQEGVFKYGDNIVGKKSAAVGVVHGYSEDTGTLIISLTSGNFVADEIVRVVNSSAVGVTGVQAKAGAAETAIQGAKASGRPICTMSMGLAALSTLMAGQEFVNCVIGLEETDGSAVLKVLGQCDVRIDNAFTGV